MLSRILVPTDSSPDSERAFPLAERLATLHDAEVLVAQAVQYPVITEDYQLNSPETWQQITDILTQSADANLNAVAGRFAEQGIRVQKFLVYGSPASNLLDIERDEAVDVVVMATHGRTGLARFALGSVADRVVREGTAPVLLVRAEVDPIDTAMSRVLLLLDGSELAEQALPIVEGLAGKPITSVRLLRGIDREEDRQAALLYLQGVADRLGGAGVSCEIVVDVGDPSRLYRGAAQGLDLIVLCTHGRGGFDRLRHGSVAEEVVRGSDLPVLLIRARTAPAATA